MTQKLNDLFDDAHRRLCIQKSRNERRRASCWIGLATPAQMRPMVTAGYVMDQPGATPRILHWWSFTPQGWAEYDRRFKDAPDWFAPEYQDFKFSAPVDK